MPGSSFPSFWRGRPWWAIATWRAAAARLVATRDTEEPSDEGLLGHEGEELQQLATVIGKGQAFERRARRALAQELEGPLTAVRGLTQRFVAYDLSPAEGEREAHLASAEAQRLQGMAEGLSTSSVSRSALEEL